MINLPIFWTSILAIRHVQDYDQKGRELIKNIWSPVDTSIKRYMSPVRSKIYRG